jgi:uncharacterized protein YaeQ
MKSAPMALPSTLHHFDLSLAHVDRGIERPLTLKAARHPSESMERLWLRLVALAWQWEETIGFGPGLCEPEAADVIANHLDGRPALLVRVGKPDAERVARDVAQGQGARVAVLFESPRRLEAFLADARAKGLDRLAKAELAAIDPDLLKELVARDDRRVRGSLTIVADHLYLELDGRAIDGPLHRATY